MPVAKVRRMRVQEGTTTGPVLLEASVQISPL